MTSHDTTMFEISEKEEEITKTENNPVEEVEGQGYPCDKCDKRIPNNKAAKDLHMYRAHNMKTLQSTPGPANLRVKESSIEMKTRSSIKCSLCSYTCKSKPTMKKHVEIFHNKKIHNW